MGCARGLHSGFEGFSTVHDKVWEGGSKQPSFRDCFLPSFSYAARVLARALLGAEAGGWVGVYT